MFFASMVVADASLAGLLKLLADSTRLRILALLELRELSVGELARALGMAQSRVSNHLRLLREADLLVERHEGTSTFLKLSSVEDGVSPVERLWQALKPEVDALAEHAADKIRLDRVLASRRAKDGDFFDRVAGEWDKIAGDFATGQARHRAVLHLLPPEFVVADLGCGTGYVTEALLGACGRVICVDRSKGMLAEAKKRLAHAARGTAVEYRRGELDRLPLGDGEVDGVVAGMVLHHLASLQPPVREMFRALKPGGTAVVLELAPHKETWMRAELGDRHLGLEPKDVLVAFQRAGFVDTAIEPVTDEYRPRAEDGAPVHLSLYLVRGRKPRDLNSRTETS